MDSQKVCFAILATWVLCTAVNAAPGSVPASELAPKEEPVSVPTSELAPKEEPVSVPASELAPKTDSGSVPTSELAPKAAPAQAPLSPLAQEYLMTANALEVSRGQLVLAQQNLLALSQELVKFEAEYAVQQKATVMRLRFLQRQSSQPWWSLLFTSQNLNAVLDRRYQLGQVFNQDQQILIGLQTQRQALDQKRLAVEAQKNDIALLIEQLSAKQANIEKRASTQSDLVYRLSTQPQAYESAQQRLASDSGQLAEMIRSLSANQAQIPAPLKMALPVQGSLTSGFGFRVHPIFGIQKMHTGIDLAASSGTPISAASDGTVIFAGWYGGYGRCAILAHGTNFATLYGHTSQLMVTVGQQVKRGQIIAAVGSTGFSTGPHLHFEVRFNGTPTNPMDFLH
jgi:murein DD-endopeptidase MepM/ murein hydrolase activator NlpD